MNNQSKCQLGDYVEETMTVTRIHQNTFHSYLPHVNYSPKDFRGYQVAHFQCQPMGFVMGEYA